MPNITLIGAAQSRAIRNLWMLEELGLAYGHDKPRPAAIDARRLRGDAI